MILNGLHFRLGQEDEVLIRFRPGNVRSVRIHSGSGQDNQRWNIFAFGKVGVIRIHSKLGQDDQISAGYSSSATFNSRESFDWDLIG